MSPMLQMALTKRNAAKMAEIFDILDSNSSLVRRGVKAKIIFGQRTVNETPRCDQYESMGS